MSAGSGVDKAAVAHTHSVDCYSAMKRKEAELVLMT